MRAANSVLRSSLRSLVLMGESIGARWAAVAALTAALEGTWVVRASEVRSSKPMSRRDWRMPSTDVWGSVSRVSGNVRRKMPSRVLSVVSPCWRRQWKSQKIGSRSAKNSRASSTPMCRRLHTAVSMVTVVDWGRDRVHVRNWSDAHTVVILLIVTTATMAYFFEAGVLAMSSSRQYVA